MLIDWFTVLAQVLNFLVLLYLLKRFLYRPILAAIDARETLIAKQLAAAAENKAAAQAELLLYQQQHQALLEQQQRLLQEASTTAQAAAAEIVSTARSTAEQIRRQAQLALEEERRRAALALLAQIRQEVVATARQTLADLCGINLEQAYVLAFIAHLQQLDAATRTLLTAAVSPHGGAPQAWLRSATSLSPAQQAMITEAVHTQLSPQAELVFDVASELVGGLELTLNGRKLAWSVAAYLDGLNAHTTAQP
ncbi:MULTISPECIES: F0F1 ATP synthase subunit B [unclassified Undibacterium]|uniref:F0F1 ATP synthase subunit B family protein n=1 Tax=unclassified Undibacterium TaxID=2630295 RepID=UPI002AC8957E|nr:MULTISPECIES: F0F1 ATP synthase subunit B [unclassified Undibacterium]MEB0140636.1 F0F1 ATP synthase subunit B [Undibacterium sp. CCC2.1]MEB0173665.1 F0F1 ATP synthase subunit B [Undibacterium sp. CCC1.1]MEB0177649.1 F0F1 ATP synthase subunit B [Undibacterium sp. CCC3.4]MEB0216834.1 F0F1 ATP synthase subunit B [Undibacterium sp. 5I2]WPX41922.1 F0F1 ATP synthase subunit B [Undibacterium sp. CCC3.4]